VCCQKQAATAEVNLAEALEAAMPVAQPRPALASGVPLLFHAVQIAVAVDRVHAAAI
jgi:hypothetical protein